MLWSRWQFNCDGGDCEDTCGICGGPGAIYPEDLDDTLGGLQGQPPMYDGELFYCCENEIEDNLWVQCENGYIACDGDCTGQEYNECYNKNKRGLNFAN